MQSDQIFADPYAQAPMIFDSSGFDQIVDVATNGSIVLWSIARPPVLVCGVLRTGLISRDGHSAVSPELSVSVKSSIWTGELVPQRDATRFGPCSTTGHNWVRMPLMILKIPKKY